MNENKYLSFGYNHALKLAVIEDDLSSCKNLVKMGANFLGVCNPDEKYDYVINYALKNLSVKVIDYVFKQNKEILLNLPNNPVSYIVEGYLNEYKKYNIDNNRLIEKTINCLAIFKGHRCLDRYLYHMLLEKNITDIDWMVDVYKSFVIAGVDVNYIDEKNKNGYLELVTSLHKSKNSNVDELIGLLLENGANPNGVCIDSDMHDRPIDYACYYGQLEVVKKLIKSGADVNLSKTNILNNLAHARNSADEDVRLEILNLLIENGLKINEQYTDSTNSLTIFLRYRNEQLRINSFKLVNRLIEVGADVFLDDNDGHNFYDLVTRNDKSEEFKEKYKSVIEYVKTLKEAKEIKSGLVSNKNNPKPRI